ncbi:MAG: hypothetical protein ACI3V5_05175 [Faecousia sp.]
MLQKLKQKTFPWWMILLIMAMPFAAAILTELLCLPSAVLSFVDAAWICLLVLILKDWKRLRSQSVQVRCIFAAVLLFFLSTLVGLALGYQSVLYYLWGLRNNFSYFVFFFACVLYLKSEDVDWYWKCFDALFAVNFLVTLFQFFVLKYEQDYLGGIFGVQQGCNRQTNVFLMIVVTYSIVRYLNQKEKPWVCLLKCAMALLIAALAELKMFILEFAAIVVLAVLLTKFSRRKIFLLIGGAVGAVVAIQLLTFFFPYWEGWFSLEKIWSTATDSGGYTGIMPDGEVNRLTVVPIAWTTYLTTWPQKLFGLGLGQCDFGPFGFLMTPFYVEHHEILYTLFHSGMLMLETGLVGLILYCGILITIFAAVHSIERRGRGNLECCQTAKILALMCFALLIYNESLRSCYTGYMAFFILALPFIKPAE